METNCSECGRTHEVGESQKGSYMFCLGCDKFFRVEAKTEAHQKENNDDSSLKKSVRYIEEPKKIVPSLLPKECPEEIKRGLKEKLKTTFKKIFIFADAKSKAVLPEAETESVLEADPPKMDEAAIAAATKRFALIDDFLEPEMDFENEPEDVPAEYIDFLSVGLDVSSSDFLEQHAKNKADEHPHQKEQE